MKMVKANDIHLAYEDTGRGKVIVLLHGNSATHQEMDLFKNELCKNYRVLSFDLRGHGLSDKGKDKYSIKLLATDILSACKNLGIEECDGIGFSDGGNVLLTIASIQEGFLNHSVLLSPNYNVSGMKMNWVIGLRILYFFSSIKNFFKRCYGGSHSKTRLMVKDYGFKEKELALIHTNTLILEAEKDMIKHNHLKKLNSLLKKSRLITIKDTTHFTIINSDETLGLVQDYLLD